MTLPIVKIKKGMFANFAKPTLQSTPIVANSAPNELITSISQAVGVAFATTGSKQQNSISQLQLAAYPPPKDVYQNLKITEAGEITLNPSKDPQSPEYKSAITFYRPEIISLTKFNPLYDEQGNQTENGSLFEALIESLRKIDVDARNFLNSSQESKNAVLESNEKLKVKLESLNSRLKQIQTFIKFFTSLQNRININDVFFKLKPQEFLSANFLDSNLTTYSSLTRYVSQIDKNLSLNESLNRCLEYDDKDVDKLNNFFGHSATKCWVVSLAEMKTMINSHSRRNMKVKLSSQGNQDGFNSYPFIKVGDRITAQNLLDIGVGISINTIAGQTNTLGGEPRFSSLQDYYNRFTNDNAAMSAVLYVVLKEVRQRICSTFKNENVTIDVRNKNLDSLILNEYKNQFVHSRLNAFTGASLYDIGVFGDIKSRENPIFVLEPANVVKSTQELMIGNKYFFEGFGSEEFFTQFLSADGTSDVRRVEDYLLSIEAVKSLFFNFISSSGVLPIDDSKINPAFSTDVVTFFEDICSNFLNASGEFITTKPYTKAHHAGKYVSGTNDGLYDLDALTFFGLASGADNLIGTMQSSNIEYKAKLVGENKFQLDSTSRTPAQNVALLKNALYSYILQRIEEEDVYYTCREIYGVLSNIAVDNQTTPEQFGESGKSQVTDDEVVKYAIFNIKPSDGTEASRDVPPIAAEEIKITLQNSKLVNAIIEIMRPIVSSNEARDFSLVIFDFICRLIGHLAPFTRILVYLGAARLVFFTGFHAKSQSNNISANLFKSSVTNNLITETNSLITLAFSTYNITNNLSVLFNDAKNKLLSFKNIASYITEYLDSDPRKFALLFNDQQLSLLMSSFQDVYDSYNTFANSNNTQSQVDQVFNSYLSGMHYSPKIVSILRSFFKDPEYASIKGYNKQIMTVGIPQGLLKELHNKFKTKADFENLKSCDIFKILIYKIDLLNDEIVYLPKEFLFEASRFPVKTYSKISDISNVEISSHFETSLFKLFPTRDYSIYSAKDGDKTFIESKPNSDVKEAFISANYPEFLTRHMSSILKNHIVSFILENYLQIISGMQFNESPFILANNDEINTLYSNLYEQSQIPQKSIAKNLEFEIATNSEFQKKIALNLAFRNPNPFIKSLVHPKKFDRVFNIIFDPEFIVDESKSDKSKIEKMVNSQKLKKVNAYYIDTDKSFIDPAFNSYFVNIETLSIDTDKKFEQISSKNVTTSVKPTSVNQNLNISSIDPALNSYFVNI